MKLIFIYGPPAAGKLTIARELGRLIGWPVFHNHLVVDAVMSVFPFGSDQFIRLREKLWLDVIREAVAADRSLIFTFAPEPTVAPGFHQRVVDIVAAKGGNTSFVKLTVPEADQEERIAAASRAEFGKLRSLELLRELRPQFKAAESAMPAADLTIDTAIVQPDAAALHIVDGLALPAL